MMCSQEPVHFQLPVFENQFTSTELDELLSFFQPTANSIDDETSQGQPVSSNSGSDEPMNRIIKDSDEKKQKRKISNRESAKRSRWRKKRHLEDLTVQVNQLKVQNREYKNRLHSILYQLHVVNRQNDRFRFESMNLIRRHSELNRVLQAMQLLHKSRIVSGLRFH